MPKPDMGTPSGGGSAMAEEYKLEYTALKMRLASMISYQTNGNLGFIIGASVEWYQPSWVPRYGIFQEPRHSNMGSYQDAIDDVIRTADIILSQIQRYKYSVCLNVE